ncbi:MAG: L,D-transpeptidase family protein, partial [Microthrixaceae bacterium]|nr:L,D-transpeptidase family protein [Microthrixaceae bacterium]
KYFNGGIALHGSPSVPSYPASHGCVRLTDPEINFLWGTPWGNIGTTVWVY